MKTGLWLSFFQFVGRILWAASMTYSSLFSNRFPAAMSLVLLYS